MSNENQSNEPIVDQVTSDVVESISKSVETHEGNITVRIFNDMDESLTYEFRPHEDITAFELAKCLPLLLMLILTERVEQTLVKNLPEHCQRHWRLKNHGQPRQPDGDASEVRDSGNDLDGSAGSGSGGDGEASA